MSLVSENFRNAFGEIRLQVIFQDRTTRLSCLRRADDAVLSFHIVLFREAGIKEFGDRHEKIVAGEMLGEVIQASGVPHTRTISDKSSIEMDANLVALFMAAENRCTTERIEYRIRDVPYAMIYEFYNPTFTPVAAARGALPLETKRVIKNRLSAKLPGKDA